MSSCMLGWLWLTWARTLKLKRYQTSTNTRQDLGISVARRCGIDANERPLALSQPEYDDACRTYRTLVHLQWQVDMP